MKKILYISIVLPSVTTTFVYREIQSLQKAGYEIETVSMGKPPLSHVHEEALSLLQTTTYLDQVGFLSKCIALLKTASTKPKKTFSSLLIVFSEKEVKGFKDRLRLLWHFIGAGYLYDRLRHRRIDQIQATFLTGPASIAFFLSQLLNIPYSFTIHASNIFVDPIMLGRKLRTSKKVVTISQYNKQYLLKKYGEDLESKIHIIHCGIDVGKFQPKNLEKVSPPVILSVGQLTARKGFAFLLEACEQLVRRGFAFSCHIIGDGEEKGMLLAKANTLGLHDVVNFLGRKLQQEVRKELGKATIFCLPSIITEKGGREGIPVALMEAMAMQLPVVSTETVGIPELIENNKEGLLVPQQNAIALADALEKLLKEKEARTALGAAGREKIIRNFNIENTPEEFKIIFD